MARKRIIDLLARAEKLRLSQAEVARRTGVSAPVMNRWMHRKIGIKPHYLVPLAHALGLAPVEVLEFMLQMPLPRRRPK